MPETALRFRPLAAGFVFLLVVAGCAGATSGPNPGASAASGGAPPAAPVSAAPSAAPQDGETAAFRDDALIVRTGTLQLQVTDVDVAAASARTTIRELGGYVGASRRTSDGEHPVATITYRIPSDRWDEALDAIRGLGTKVLGEETEAEEVTSQVVDLGARITNLRASERSLQAIAERATKISEVLEVQRELTTVRGEIERLVAQRQSLEERASFGTLTVTYGVEVVAIAEAQRDWNPASEVDRASASLLDILQAVTSAGIWFAIVWLPVLLALGLLGLGASIVLRRMGILRRPTSA
jgi:hypothetical protein